MLEPETATRCTCSAAERVKIGEDVSECLDVLPAVPGHRDAPAALCLCRLPRGRAANPGTAASDRSRDPDRGASGSYRCCEDGLPLYRQEGVYGREQIELPRNLMAGWMGRIGFHLEPLT